MPLVTLVDLPRDIEEEESDVYPTMVSNHICLQTIYHTQDWYTYDYIEEEGGEPVDPFC